MENEIILDVLQRIQNLEKNQIEGWVTIIISFVALLLSILSFRKEQTFTKDNMLANIKANIDSARAQYDNHAMEIAPLAAKQNRTEQEEAEFGIKQKICDSAFEKVLNAYEDGCDYFYLNKVNKKHFMAKYHRDIIGYVNDFSDMFNDTLTHYGSIFRYYKKYHMRSL
jgi:hypothetical protein